MRRRDRAAPARTSKLVAMPTSYLLCAASSRFCDSSRDAARSARSAACCAMQRRVGDVGGDLQLERFQLGLRLAASAAIVRRWPSARWCRAAMRSSDRTFQVGASQTADVPQRVEVTAGNDADDDPSWRDRARRAAESLTGRTRRPVRAAAWSDSTWFWRLMSLIFSVLALVARSVRSPSAFGTAASRLIGSGDGGRSVGLIDDVHRRHRCR